MTLGDLKKKGAEELERANVESPLLEARIFLESLGFTTLDQIMSADMEVGKEKEEAFLSLVRMRSDHIPTAYILGHREFHGLNFEVTADTLIPRPDSETLVNAGLEALKNLSRPAILDLCTGTGCIGISVAHEIPLSTLVLSDISPKALETAGRNASALLPETETGLVLSDLFESVSGSFDLITANPPYISHLWEADLSQEVCKEPRLALFDEAQDGMDTIRRIVRDAPDHLKPGGTLAIECDYRQAESLKQMMKDMHFKDIAIHRDLAGLERVVCGHM